MVDTNVHSIAYSQLPSYFPEKHVKTSVNYKELVSSQVLYPQNDFYIQNIIKRICHQINP